jgi:hypothetical protein
LFASYQVGAEWALAVKLSSDCSKSDPRVSSLSPNLCPPEPQQTSISPFMHEIILSQDCCNNLFDVLSPHDLTGFKNSTGATLGKEKTTEWKIGKIAS